MTASLPKPTDGELAILRVLWDKGPSTVREVLEVMTEARDLGYTTVLKMLQIMTDKGLVSREEQGRSHVYKAVASMEQTQGHLVSDLLDKAFAGSALQLVMRALQDRRTSEGEREAIRKLLNEASQDQAAKVASGGER
ncbi:MAG: BlaI/MecI/CopY family transcriptional regulator [Acidobacteria bacterium]|nr:BlaI/MecI/CopY family transcriptional regulator [Acidobacteriota bacterium]